MNRKSNIITRKRRIRGKITGTAEKPRLSVFRSNKYIYAQLIDDTTAKTLLTVSEKNAETAVGKQKTLAAREVGIEIAKKALGKKIKEVIFDRGSYAYLGRIRSLAEGAREGGLQF